jgi:hypothetical protein
MRIIKISLFTLSAALIFILVSTLRAQDIDKTTKSGKLFDTKTIETVKGEISLIKKSYHEKSSGYVLGFKLKSDDETIYVHVGPGWYVEEKEFTFEKGDKVEVTGSMVTVKDKPVIIATEIIKDGKTLILRNAEGTPFMDRLG